MERWVVHGMEANNFQDQRVTVQLLQQYYSPEEIVRFTRKPSRDRTSTVVKQESSTNGNSEQNYARKVNAVTITLTQFHVSQKDFEEMRLS